MHSACFSRILKATPFHCNFREGCSQRPYNHHLRGGCVQPHTTSSQSGLHATFSAPLKWGFLCCCVQLPLKLGMSDQFGNKSICTWNWMKCVALQWNIMFMSPCLMGLGWSSSNFLLGIVWNVLLYGHVWQPPPMGLGWGSTPQNFARNWKKFPDLLNTFNPQNCTWFHYTKHSYKDHLLKLVTIWVSQPPSLILPVFNVTKILPQKMTRALTDPLN